MRTAIEVRKLMGSLRTVCNRGCTVRRDDQALQPWLQRSRVECAGVGVGAARVPDAAGAVDAAHRGVAQAPQARCGAAGRRARRAAGRPGDGRGVRLAGRRGDRGRRRGVDVAGPARFEAAAGGAAGAGLGGGGRGVPGADRRREGRRARSAGGRVDRLRRELRAIEARDRFGVPERDRARAAVERLAPRLDAASGRPPGEVGDTAGLPRRPCRVRVAAATLRRPRRRVRVRRRPRRRARRTRRRSTCAAWSCRTTTATAASRRSCAATDLDDPVLWDLARLVHEADLADERFDEPGAPGLDAICRGLTLVLDDERNLEVTAGDVRRPLRAPPPAAARRPPGMTDRCDRRGALARRRGRASCRHRLERAAPTDLRGPGRRSASRLDQSCTGTRSLRRTRDELLAVDGVLVWVDPIGRGEDRRRLDAILREVAGDGRFG